MVNHLLLMEDAELMFTATVVGQFTQTQSVAAANAEEAAAKFAAGEGEVLENTKIGDVTVSDVVLEVEEEEAA